MTEGRKNWNSTKLLTPSHSLSYK